MISGQVHDGNTASLVRVLHVAGDAEGAESGASVTAVGDRESTLRALRDGSFDCIVCDERLTDGSGLERIDEMRARGVDLPILARVGEEAAADALAAGASDVVSPTATPEVFDRRFGP